MAVKFTGPAKRIEDLDLPRIGARIGVGEDEIHAVMDVEAAGSGFNGQGRPKMLFEPHIFYRLLNGERRARAVREGLAYPNWKPGAYPRESYTRIARAMAIDETAALKAASWGLGQILGTNHREAGYPTVQAMVEDFTLDEDNHLEAMIRFIVSKGLDKHLRNHNWAAFAHGYNGPQYARHNYHGKLAARFRHWRAIRDTPWQPGQGEDEPGRYGTRPEGPRPHEQEAQDLAGDVPDEAETGEEYHEDVPTGAEEDDGPAPLSEIEMRAGKVALKKLGYHEVGAIDSDWGGRSVAAASAFQNDRGLEITGRLDEATKVELDVAAREGWTRPIAPERAEGKPANSRIVANSEKGIIATVVAAVTGFFTQFGEYLGPLRDLADTPFIKPFRELVVNNFGLILLLIGGSALYFFWSSRRARIEDHRKGELS